jgi:hypothetical protein
MSDTVIRRSARALDPYRPIMTLTELARAPRSTARSWATGHRRPSVAVLKTLRDMLRERQSMLSTLIPELDQLIIKREYEPVHRTGFCTIDQSTGRDKRNRLGRPKRTAGIKR